MEILMELLSWMFLGALVLGVLFLGFLMVGASIIHNPNDPFFERMTEEEIEDYNRRRKKYGS